MIQKYHFKTYFEFQNKIYTNLQNGAPYFPNILKLWGNI